MKVNNINFQSNCVLSESQNFWKNLFKYLYFLFIFSYLFIANPAKTEEINFIPSLSIGAGSNDNISFKNTERIKDSYVRARPEINIGLSSEKYNLGIDTYLDIYRYSEEKDLNTENYKSAAICNYQLSPRLAVYGEVSYHKDTTLDSELEETGRVLKREDRERYRTNGKISHQLDEKSEINFDYQYIKTNYESDGYSDRDAQRLSFLYRRWFNDRLDRLILRPSYSWVEAANDITINYYNVSIGWIHIFNKTLRMQSFVGHGYSVQKDDGNEDSNRTWNADISLTALNEISSIRLGIKSEIRLDADAKLKEVDQLYCRTKKKLTERLEVLFSASIYTNRPVDSYNEIDSVYYDIMPEINYQLSERHSFTIFYRYSYQEDRNLSNNQDRARNIVELNFNFIFPHKK